MRKFELSKDVEVDGVTYRIGRLEALDGSFIVGQIMTKLLPSAMGDIMSLMGVKVELPAGRSDMTREEFQEIQALALSVISRIDADAPNNPVRVFLLPRTWGVKELEYDIKTVIDLTIQSLVFNLTPFFEGNGFLSALQLMGFGSTRVDSQI